MWTKAFLLAAALAFALPGFADNSATPKTPVTKPKTKPGGHIEVGSFSFGESNPVSVPPNGKADAAGKTSIGSIHVNPCKQPNPPHDCARPRPPH